MTNPTPTNAAASYYGQTDSIQSWLDQNLGSYLEQNPGVIQANRLLGGAGAGFCPPGAIIDYGGTTLPTGWLWLDGATYDGTIPTYLNLWTAIGVLYGGTGQSSFKVPDGIARMRVGYAAAGGHTDVSTVGNNDGVALANRRPKHNHTGGGTTGATSAGTPSGTISSVTYVQDGGGGFAITHSGPNVLTSVTTTPIFTGSAMGTHTHSMGTVGPAGTNPVDAPAYIVVPGIIKL